MVGLEAHLRADESRYCSVSGTKGSDSNRKTRFADPAATSSRYSGVTVSAPRRRTATFASSGSATRSNVGLRSVAQPSDIWIACTVLRPEPAFTLRENPHSVV